MSDAAIDPLFDRLLEQGRLATSTSRRAIRRCCAFAASSSPTATARCRATTSRRCCCRCCSPTQRTQFEATGDLDFAHAHGTKARFRANYLRKLTGTGAVFRAIPTIIKTLDELGVPPGVRKLAELRAGLVLVTGPTGSRQVDDARRDDRSHQPHALGPHPHDRGSGRVRAPAAQVPRSRTRRSASTCRSFLDAIRSAGRENADVILVGELRGAETMKAALQLASFGILIFATVHTNSAAATIDRYVNAFPAEQQPQIRGLLADSLAGVVAQQLLAKADGAGRVAAHEILIGIARARVADPRGQDAADRRLHPVRASRGHAADGLALERLVKAGTVKAEAALEKALDKEGFAKAVGLKAQLAP